jgi:putative membrane protein
MKNKITIISGLVVAVAALYLAGFASAQNPRPYPALKSGANADAPKAKKDEPASKTAATSTLSAKDKTFMMNAAKGGMMEVEWGKVAAQKGQSDDVKKFGNRMVADHSKANNELMALAAKKGVKLPSEKVNVKWKSDKDYMDMMVKDHEKDLAEFQAEAKEGSDPDLKKFAEKTAKVVSKHLQMAKEIHGKLK